MIVSNVLALRQNRRRTESRPPTLALSSVGASGRNIKLTLEYDGSNYCGWQVQNRPKHKTHPASKKSIQEKLQKILNKVLQEKVYLLVSGRTDAGVHAAGQVVNFTTHSKIPLNKLQIALNGLLPEDISVIKAQDMPFDFHSRFSAKSKVYRYTILNRNFSSALLQSRVFFVSYPLDIKLIKQEAKDLIGRHNFKCFQASGAKEGTTVRNIKRINIALDKDLLYIDIEADGFLYNMVRNIVGTLIEIGRGRFAKGSIKKILRSRNRRLAGPTAPAKALCLLKVKY